MSLRDMQLLFDLSPALPLKGRESLYQRINQVTNTIAFFI